MPFCFQVRSPSIDNQIVFYYTKVFKSLIPIICEFLDRYLMWRISSSAHILTETHENPETHEIRHFKKTVFKPKTQNPNGKWFNTVMTSM